MVITFCLSFTIFGWGSHVNPWLIHVNVWKKPQYCKVISLQLTKINEKKKYKSLSCSRSIETDYSPNLVHELWFATPCACLHAESLQSCLTLCDPMDYSPPGSSTHGILQARILEWVAIPSSGGASLPRDWTYVSSTSCIGRSFFVLFCFLTTSTTWEASRVKMDQSQEGHPEELSLPLLSWALIIVN